MWRAQLCTGGDARDLFPDGMQHAPDAYAAALPQGSRSRCDGPSCHGAVIVERLVGCPVASACRSGPLRPRTCRGPAFAEEPPPAMVEDAWDLGPDEFFFLLEGPEFLKPRGVHVGGCRYVFPFTLTLPGAFRLLLLALRSDWLALEETGGAVAALPYPSGMGGCNASFVCKETPGYKSVSDRGRRLHHAPEHPFERSRFPPLTLDNLLGDKMVATFGDGGGGPPNDSARALAVSEASQCAEPGALPLCGANATAGRWVRRTSTARDFDANAPWWMSPGRSCGNDGHGIGVRYFTNLDESLEWVPYACCAPLLRRAHVEDCMGGAAAAIEIRGDSQMRYFYNKFIAEACNSTDQTFAKGVNIDACTSPSARCGAWRTCFKFDAVGKELGGEGPQAQVVVNFGQWSASGSRQSTFALWSLEVRRWAALVQRTRRPGRRVFWMEIAPFPPANFKYLHWFRDWRTTHRITLFNAEAARVLAPLVQQGALDGIIPRFDVSDPLIDASKDGAHLDHARVLSEMSRRLTVALCGA